MNLLPKGTWPVMLTPFNNDSSIDWSGLKNLIDFYLSQNVNGLFAACGSSEVTHLLPEEIIAISKFVVEYVKGRIPVVAGAICEGSIEQQADFVKKIADTGVNATIITASQITGEDSDDSHWNSLLEKLLKLTNDLPLGMYECPKPYHRLLSSEQMQLIANSGRFLFHKDTCCNIEKIALKLQAAKKTKMRFYNANVHTFIESLKIGADGFCGTALNFYPEFITWLYSNYNADDKKTLQKINEFVIESEKAFCTNYLWAAKYFLSLRGVKIKTFCRAKVIYDLAKDSHRLQQLLHETQATKNLLVSCL